MNLIKQSKSIGHQAIENKDDVFIFDKTCKEFFSQIEEILEKPLKLANRNRKLAKEREQKLASSHKDKEDESVRFLEDHFITISDLILFYSITMLMELSRAGRIRKILQSSFKKTCKW